MEKSLGQALNAQLVKPKKQLGQYWLKRKSVLNKIIDSADLKKEDLVIEIGPGLGVLTKELAGKAGKVIAIEKDHLLIPLLKEKFKNNKNVEIIEDDILRLVSSIEYRVSSIKNTEYKIPDTKYKIVANLPYYAATHIIRQFLETKNKPELMVLMLQKEVAQRVCAKPPLLRSSSFGGQAKMSLLAISIQLYADAKIIDYVSKNAFSPKPKIDSAIIKIKPLTNNKKSVDIDLFFKIVKAGFSQPRKQLLNNLSKNLKLPKEEIKIWLLKNNLKPEQRAESLTIDDWFVLTKYLNKFAPNSRFTNKFVREKKVTGTEKNDIL